METETPAREKNWRSFFMSFSTRNPSSDYPPKATESSFNGSPKSQTEELSKGPESQLSDGEIHYLYWFIQGSIMDPDIRQRLRRAWGFCERHAWGYILVEAAFYRGYMHGASLLYEDLLTPALSAFHLKGPFKCWRFQKSLLPKGPCPMCEMGFGPHSKGIVRPELIERGRDITELGALARKTETYWEKTICGRCARDGSGQRCRRHLIEDVSSGWSDTLSAHAALVEYIFYHLSRYHRSFRLEFQGTETEEDMAALISAVGWCSGWESFLSTFSPFTRRKGDSRE
jgi:hypothetical protein